MADKNLKARIVNKNGTSAEWEKATSFIPKKGELILYTDLNKIKIGDGVTKVNALPFLTVPNKTSDLTNDSGYVTNTSVDTKLNDKVDKVAGKTLSTNDLTNTLKSNYDAAYTHSKSAHAPSNAERNTIVGIQKNGSDVSINSSTRKVNITVPTKTSELTNDSGFLTSVPVTSVNNKTGVIKLTASDVGALASADLVAYTATEIDTMWNAVTIS